MVLKRKQPAHAINQACELKTHQAARLYATWLAGITPRNLRHTFRLRDALHCSARPSWAHHRSRQPLQQEPLLCITVAVTAPLPPWTTSSGSLCSDARLRPTHVSLRQQCKHTAAQRAQQPSSKKLVPYVFAAVSVIQTLKNSVGSRARGNSPKTKQTTLRAAWTKKQILGSRALVDHAKAE
jgi:hypothetical protein